jgi:hypothetical protein
MKRLFLSFMFVALVVSNVYSQSIPKLYQGSFAGFEAAIETSTQFIEVENMDRGLWMMASATHIALPKLAPDAVYSEMRVVNVKQITKKIGNNHYKGYSFLYVGATVPFYVYHTGKDSDGDQIFILQYKNSDNNNVYIKMVKIVE